MEKFEKKIADKYNAEHGQQQQAPAQPPPQQPQQQQAPPPPPPEGHKHHGGGIVGKLGNAAIFGAGATAGADAVNGLIN